MTINNVMREFIKMLEGFVSEAAEITVSAKEMASRYGAKIMPFAQLPDNAKGALKQYMIIDGENEEYDQQSYGYLELPIEEVIKLMDDQFGNDDDARGLENWKTDKIMFRYNYPTSSIWPLIWGNHGFEDGSHRFHRYTMTGVKIIPIVLCL